MPPIPSLLELCKEAFVKHRHTVGDIGRIPLPAIACCLSHLDEAALRAMEAATLTGPSRMDLLWETWPLWYSLYIRRFGAAAAAREVESASLAQLPDGSADSCLLAIEQKKQRMRDPKFTTIPYGDWRLAYDINVFDYEIRIRRCAQRSRQQEEARCAAEPCVREGAAKLVVKSGICKRVLHKRKEAIKKLRRARLC